MGFKFLHAADLHLDTPFQGLTRVNPLLGNKLKTASIRVLDKLVSLAIDEKVDFVLIAGDIYDGAKYGLRAEASFTSALRRLSAQGIRVFYVFGNHDPVDSMWNSVTTQALAHQFGQKEVETQEFEVQGTRITVSGTSYATRAVTENLAAKFPRPTGPGFHIALLHATIGGTEWDTNYAPCSIEDLQRSGHNYWALGHIHTRKIVQEHDPTIVYPGNTQGRSFAAAELAPKGVVLVEVDDNLEVRCEFREIDLVRFHEVRLDCTSSQKLTDLIYEAAAQVDAQEWEQEMVVRLVLEGRTHLYADLQREGADEFLKALDDQTRSSKIHWVELRNQLRGPIEMDAIRRQDSLSGVLLRCAEHYVQDPERVGTLLKHPGLGHVEFSTRDVETIIDQAKMRLLHLIQEGK